MEPLILFPLFLQLHVEDGNVIMAGRAWVLCVTVLFPLLDCGATNVRIKGIGVVWHDS